MPIRTEADALFQHMMSQARCPHCDIPLHLTGQHQLGCKYLIAQMLGMQNIIERRTGISNLTMGISTFGVGREADTPDPVVRVRRVRRSAPGSFGNRRYLQLWFLWADRVRMRHIANQD